MKSKQTHSKLKPRSHGLSRLERLLVKSISAELKIKSLKAELCALSARVSRMEVMEIRQVSDSSEIWPYRPTFNGFTGLERSKP
jgi:hypothetical protein